MSSRHWTQSETSLNGPSFSALKRLKPVAQAWPSGNLCRVPRKWPWSSVIPCAMSTAQLEKFSEPWAWRSNQPRQRCCMELSSKMKHILKYLHFCDLWAWSGGKWISRNVPDLCSWDEMSFRFSRRDSEIPNKYWLFKSAWKLNHLLETLWGSNEVGDAENAGRLGQVSDLNHSIERHKRSFVAFSMACVSIHRWNFKCKKQSHNAWHRWGSQSLCQLRAKTYGRSWSGWPTAVRSPEPSFAAAKSAKSAKSLLTWRSRLSHSAGLWHSCNSSARSFWIRFWRKKFCRSSLSSLLTWACHVGDIWRFFQGNVQRLVQRSRGVPCSALWTERLYTCSFMKLQGARGDLPFAMVSGGLRDGVATATDFFFKRKKWKLACKIDLNCNPKAFYLPMHCRGRGRVPLAMSLLKLQCSFGFERNLQLLFNVVFCFLASPGAFAEMQFSHKTETERSLWAFYSSLSAMISTAVSWTIHFLYHETLCWKRNSHPGYLLYKSFSSLVAMDATVRVTSLSDATPADAFLALAKGSLVFQNTESPSRSKK